MIKDIENIIKKKVAQLKYQDVLNELKRLIVEFNYDRVQWQILLKGLDSFHLSYYYFYQFLRNSNSSFDMNILTWEELPNLNLYI